MSTQTQLDFVNLSWINNSGSEFTACFPREKAEIMYNKHLLPQKDAGNLRDVRIHEII